MDKRQQLQLRVQAVRDGALSILQKDYGAIKRISKHGPTEDDVVLCRKLALFAIAEIKRSKIELKNE